MTTTNLNHNLIIRSTRYTVTGSTGTAYTVHVDPDGLTRCDCKAGSFGKDCRHQRQVREGNAGKPIIRVSQRPARRVISDEMRDFISTLDV